METPTEIATGEQPAATLAEVSAQQSQAGNSSPLDNASFDELCDLADSIPSGEPEAHPAAQAQAAPAPAEAIEAATEQAPPADSEPTTFRKRISANGVPTTEAQQAAAAFDMLRKGEASTLAEAVSILTGGNAAQEPGTAQPQQQATEQSATPATPENPAVASAQVAEIKSKIEELRAQRDQADDDFDRPAFRKLTSQIEDLGLELLRTEQAAERQAVANVSYDQQFAAVAATVEATYPQLADETSPMSRILEDRITAAEARGDKALADPNFIQVFADQVAKDLGIIAGTSAPTTPQLAPARPSRPVGSGLAPGHQSTVRLSREQASKGIEQLSPEQQFELVDSILG